jgi:hypothetical protein
VLGRRKHSAVIGRGKQPAVAAPPPSFGEAETIKGESGESRFSLDLPGWSERSMFGYDHRDPEDSWAQLWRDTNTGDEPDSLLGVIPRVGDIGHLVDSVAARTGADIDAVRGAMLPVMSGPTTVEFFVASPWDAGDDEELPDSAEFWGADTPPGVPVALPDGTKGRLLKVLTQTAQGVTLRATTQYSPDCGSVAEHDLGEYRCNLSAGHKSGGRFGESGVHQRTDPDNGNWIYAWGGDGDYWDEPEIDHWRQTTDSGLVIYGKAFTLAEIEDAEKQDMGDTVADVEKQLATIRGYHQQGLRYSRCYSALCPAGEGGYHHISYLVPITAAQFEDARQAGWRS